MRLPDHSRVTPPMLVLAGVLVLRDSLSMPSGLPTVLLQSWLVLSRGPTGSGPGELQATNSGPFLQRSLVPVPFIHSCLQPTEVALLTLSFPHAGAGIGQVALRGETTWVSYVVSYAYRKEGSFLHPGWPI